MKTSQKFIFCEGEPNTEPRRHVPRCPFACPLTHDAHGGGWGRGELRSSIALITGTLSTNAPTDLTLDDGGMEVGPRRPPRAPAAVASIDGGGVFSDQASRDAGPAADTGIGDAVEWSWRETHPTEGTSHDAPATPTTLTTPPSLGETRATARPLLGAAGGGWASVGRKPRPNWSLPTIRQRGSSPIRVGRMPCPAVRKAYLGEPLPPRPCWHHHLGPWRGRRMTPNRTTPHREGHRAGTCGDGRSPEPRQQHQDASMPGGPLTGKTQMPDRSEHAGFPPPERHDISAGSSVHDEASAKLVAPGLHATCCLGAYRRKRG